MAKRKTHSRQRRNLKRAEKRRKHKKKKPSRSIDKRPRHPADRNMAEVMATTVALMEGVKYRKEVGSSGQYDAEGNFEGNEPG